ncbi:MAG TPA: phosphotransferase [Candidatus Limnocylindrales bacterium]|nr:phosphotransferase [Candidatus Limnocylindrales bacterium]
MRPPDDDVDRIERALGWRPVTFRSATPDRGESATAARWIVGGAGGRGRSAFVKIGATTRTADWTRTEARNYAALSGSFLPVVLGFDDDGSRPALALEDLSDGAWPPPWTTAAVGAARDALAAIHATPPPAHLTPIDWADEWGWPFVAEDPAPFLSLGLCSGSWLDNALPALIDAAAAAPLGGPALIHGDIRGDNLCVRDGRAIVIDWNHATIGNPDFDVAAWLPSLAADGGPLPESILPDAPELAAWVAGYFCAHAGLPSVPDAPHVRPLQLAQARTALPWAARALGLPPP